MERDEDVDVARADAARRRGSLSGAAAGRRLVGHAAHRPRARGRRPPPARAARLEPRRERGAPQPATAASWTSRWREDGDGAVVRVENSGPRVPPEAAAALLEPFQRLARGAGGGPGAGVGLSLVRAVASAHGGSVRLSARQEGGLRVEVRLPTAVRGGREPLGSGARARGSRRPASHGSSWVATGTTTGSRSSLTACASRPSMPASPASDCANRATAATPVAIRPMVRGRGVGRSTWRNVVRPG